MLHNVSLPSNLIKVTVQKVLYGDVAILVPTSEVTIVVEALHTFIAWPRHLVRPISDSTIYLCTNRIIYQIYYIPTNLIICLFVDEQHEPKTKVPLQKKKKFSIDDPVVALVEVV